MRVLMTLKIKPGEYDYGAYYATSTEVEFLGGYNL